MLTKREIQPLKPTNKTAGIDVGIKEFAIIHDGEKNYHIENPKYLQKSEKKLIKLQRQLSRKQKGSKNYEKVRQKVAKQYQKIVNQRKDFLHKVSSAITKQYDCFVVESLNIKGMIQNQKLSKQIADVSWYEFIRQLEYKARWKGKQLMKVDRFYANSKTCNVCGYKNNQLTLSIRQWQCPVCKTVHDRDENASINLYKIGFTHLTGGRAGTAQAKACRAGSVGGMEYNLQSTRHSAMKQETSLKLASLQSEQAPQFIEK